MAEKEADFYHKLRKKISSWLESKEGHSYQWSKYIIWAPDLFYLLWKLSIDPGVPKSERIKLLAVIAYFILPIDLIPEAIFGPIGYADDIVLTALVLNGLINNSSPELVKKYWPGDEDVLDVIKKILAVADKMVGKKVWQKLLKKVS